MEIFITHSDNSDECVPYHKVGGPVFYFGCHLFLQTGQFLREFKWTLSMATMSCKINCYWPRLETVLFLSAESY